MLTLHTTAAWVPTKSVDTNIIRIINFFILCLWKLICFQENSSLLFWKFTKQFTSIYTHSWVIILFIHWYISDNFHASVHTINRLKCHWFIIFCKLVSVFIQYSQLVKITVNFYLYFVSISQHLQISQHKLSFDSKSFIVINEKINIHSRIGTYSLINAFFLSSLLWSNFSYWILTWKISKIAHIEIKVSQLLEDAN